MIVKTNLITELPLLDSPVKLGSLKTLGLNLGEKKDISELKEETLVGLPTLLLIPLSEFDDIIYH